MGHNKLSSKSGFNVCIMGASLNTGNRGVSALCASIVGLILERVPHAEIFLLIGNRDSKPQELRLARSGTSLHVVNYRLSPKASYKEHLFVIFFMAFLYRVSPIKLVRKVIVDKIPFLQTLKRADLVGEIRGGDSFSDIYGLRRFVFGCVPVLIALLLGKKIVLLPQTYGPYNTLFSKLLAHFIIKRSALVFCRYREGVYFIKKFVKHISPEKIHFCPDVAFTLDAVAPEHIIIEPHSDDISKGQALIGVNINGLMYNGGYSGGNMFGLKVDYKQFIKHLLCSLLEKTEANILLVPHTFGRPGNINSDPDASREVICSLGKKANGRVFLVAQEYGQSEIKNIIGMCDFFIGSRMHACIAALSQGIPTVGIAYSHKFIGVFDSIGSAELVMDARYLKESDIISNTIELYNKRDVIHIALEQKISHAKKIIGDNFDKMFIKNHAEDSGRKPGDESVPAEGW